MEAAGVQSLYAVPGTMARQQVLNDAVRDGYLLRERRQIYTRPASPQPP